MPCATYWCFAVEVRSSEWQLRCSQPSPARAFKSAAPDVVSTADAAFAPWNGPVLAEYVEPNLGVISGMWLSRLGPQNLKAGFPCLSWVWDGPFFWESLFLNPVNSKKDSGKGTLLKRKCLVLVTTPWGCRGVLSFLMFPSFRHSFYSTFYNGFLPVVAFSARFAVFFEHSLSVIWHARVCCVGALLWLGFVGKLQICGGCGGGMWWRGVGWGGVGWGGANNVLVY